MGTEVGRLFTDDQPWCLTRDGDPLARRIFQRHYSYRAYRDNRVTKLFCGPGEKMVLLTKCGLALFVWRKFISMDPSQTGINCAVFRNESSYLSSFLIKQAEAIAQTRWPGERMYTYVNPRKIANKANPGYCFKVCGWRECGRTKRHNLIVLEKAWGPTSD